MKEIILNCFDDKDYVIKFDVNNITSKYIISCGYHLFEANKLLYVEDKVVLVSELKRKYQIINILK